jgi:hypothetical protein
MAAYTPTTVSNAPPEPKFRPAILESVSVAEANTATLAPTSTDIAVLGAPDVAPAPRPTPSIFSRMKIGVALQSFAGEAGCLAEALYYEARGQGLDGQKAIAEVVVRRTHQGNYPHSICGVVHQGNGSACQFSFVCDGTMNRPKAMGEWNHAIQLATQIITGAMPLTDITQGAISFHAARIAANWPGMVRTAIIGNNVFYRRVGRGSVQTQSSPSLQAQLLAVPQDQPATAQQLQPLVVSQPQPSVPQQAQPAVSQQVQAASPQPAQASAVQQAQPSPPTSEVKANIQAGSGVGEGARGDVINAGLGNGANAAVSHPAGSLQQGATVGQGDSTAQVIQAHVVEQDGVSAK